MPGQRFNVNAAWFKIAILSYNLASAIKGLCFDPAERTPPGSSGTACGSSTSPAG